MLELFAQQGIETLGVTGTVAVEEAVLGLGKGLFLQHVVHAGEGVEVVVGEVVDDLFHGVFVFSRNSFQKAKVIRIHERKRKSAKIFCLIRHSK